MSYVQPKESVTCKTTEYLLFLNFPLVLLCGWHRADSLALLLLVVFEQWEALAGELQGRRRVRRDIYSHFPPVPPAGSLWVGSVLLLNVKVDLSLLIPLQVVLCPSSLRSRVHVAFQVLPSQGHYAISCYFSG